MNENLRQKAGLVYNVVESIVLLMSVGLVCWLATVVISQGQILAAHSNQILTTNNRVEQIEMHGSRAVESVVARVDGLAKQMDEMRSAIMTLQAAPGELKAINVRLDSLREGQMRIEKSLDEHMKEGKQR